MDQMSIRAIRHELGMSQQDVADRLGVTRQTVIEWEKGNIHNKELTIHALASLFGVKVEFIRLPEKVQS